MELVYSDVASPFPVVEMSSFQLKPRDRLILTSTLDLYALSCVLHDLDVTTNTTPVHVVLWLGMRDAKVESQIHYLHLLVAGLNAEFSSNRIVIHTLNKSKESTPKPPFFTWVHVSFLMSSLCCFLLFSSFSMMDKNTLRPNANFNGTLKQVAKWTNFPIKLGLVHFFLYLLEFFWLADESLFAVHLGQRITTLWIQLLQPARFGQHLQMHVETLLQIADDIHDPAMKPMYLKIFWMVLIVGIHVQNALTSLAFHSLQEQAVGFGLGVIKYILFDLNPRGNYINFLCGNMLASGGKRKLMGGMAILGLAMAWNNFEFLHPTSMASLILLGGGLVELLYG